MDKLRSKALKLGATDFNKSNVKGKRYYVIYNNRKINFGSSVGKTYIDHKDQKKRAAWRARHSKIKLKDGRFAYKDKSRASYWALNLTW